MAQDKGKSEQHSCTMDGVKIDSHWRKLVQKHFGQSNIEANWHEVQGKYKLRDIILEGANTTSVIYAAIVNFICVCWVLAVSE